jgi:hypothetical protein
MALVVWRTGAWRLCIVKRSDAAGFEVRTFGWISRNRSLARDFERYAATVVASFASQSHHAQAARCKHLVMNLNFLDGL